MRRLFGDFFKGKTVLITGHTGFIGSWLSIWLNEANANVVGYALPPYTNKDNFVVTNLQEKIVSIIGDIRNFDKIKDTFKKYQPDIVFHLAAQPIVRKSYKIPKETYDVNVGGTVNIFEAFRRDKNSRVLINVTTDKCYENQENIEGYKEEDRLGGYEPYSSSKACSELVTSAYKTSFFKSKSSQNLKIVSSVRCGNVIGGGDWQEDRLIPDCMRALRDNIEIFIRNPNSIRPWQYVLEPIRGFLILAMKMWENNDRFSGAWNFGPDKNTIFKVIEVVDKITKYMRRGSYKFIPEQETDKLHETKKLILDCMKAKINLGWESALNMDETIKFLCDWYLEGNVDYDFDVAQIKSYLKKIN